MRDSVRSEPHRTAIAGFWDWRDEDGGATVEWTESSNKILVMAHGASGTNLTDEEIILARSHVDII
jgi:hypothetical protein